MSLELGWMAPGLARRYVDACHEAGLLLADGEDLRLAFDPKAVDVPRGFRPDPGHLPTGSAVPMPERSDTAPPADAPAAATPQAAGDTTSEAPDAFGAWLGKVAAARGEDLGATMGAMEAMQERTGGLLFAEAAILVLGAEAGLDVAAAAEQALKVLQA